HGRSVYWNRFALELGVGAITRTVVDRAIAASGCSASEQGSAAHTARAAQYAGVTKQLLGVTAEVPAAQRVVLGSVDAVNTAVSIRSGRTSRSGRSGRPLRSLLTYFSCQTDRTRRPGEPSRPDHARRPHWTLRPTRANHTIRVPGDQPIWRTASPTGRQLNILMPWRYADRDEIFGGTGVCHARRKQRPHRDAEQHASRMPE